MSIVHVPGLPFYSAYQRRIAGEESCGCKTCVDNKLLGIALEEAGDVLSYEELLARLGPAEHIEGDVPSFEELNRRFHELYPTGGKKRKSRKGRKSRKSKKSRKGRKTRKHKKSHRRSRRR